MHLGIFFVEGLNLTNQINNHKADQTARICLNLDFVFY